MYGRAWKSWNFFVGGAVFPRHGARSCIPLAAETAVAAEIHSLRVRCRSDRFAVRAVSRRVFPLCAAVHRL